MNREHQMKQLINMIMRNNNEPRIGDLVICEEMSDNDSNDYIIGHVSSINVNKYTNVSSYVVDGAIVNQLTVDTLNKRGKNDFIVSVMVSDNYGNTCFELYSPDLNYHIMKLFVNMFALETEYNNIIKRDKELQAALASKDARIEELLQGLCDVDKYVDKQYEHQVELHKIKLDTIKQKLNALTFENYLKCESDSDVRKLIKENQLNDIEFCRAPSKDTIKKKFETNYNLQLDKLYKLEQQYSDFVKDKSKFLDNYNTLIELGLKECFDDITFDDIVEQFFIKTQHDNGNITLTNKYNYNNYNYTHVAFYDILMAYTKRDEYDIKINQDNKKEFILYKLSKVSDELDNPIIADVMNKLSTGELTLS